MGSGLQKPRQMDVRTNRTAVDLGDKPGREITAYGQPRACARGRAEVRRSFRGSNLDQVSARVVQDGGSHSSHLGRLLREINTECPESLELLVHVMTTKGAEGDPVADERCLKRLGGRMRVGLAHQLGPVWVVSLDDGEPAVLTERDIGLLLEAEDVRVEVKRLVLIVDEDTGQVDAGQDPAASGRIAFVREAW
jgi:hypothetical protein